MFQPQIDEGGRNAEQKDRVPLEIVNSQRVSNQNVRKAKQGWDLIGPAADMGGDFFVVDIGNHDLTHQIG